MTSQNARGNSENISLVPPYLHRYSNLEQAKCEKQWSIWVDMWFGKGVDGGREGREGREGK